MVMFNLGGLYHYAHLLYIPSGRFYNITVLIDQGFIESGRGFGSGCLWRWSACQVIPLNLP